METIGSIIRRQRRYHRISMKEFIAILDNKISTSYLSRVECHNEVPKPFLLVQIANIFKMDIEDILWRAKQQQIAKYKAKLTREYDEAVELFMKGKK